MAKRRYAAPAVVLLFCPAPMSASLTVPLPHATSQNANSQEIRQTEFVDASGNRQHSLDLHGSMADPFGITALAGTGLQLAIKLRQLIKQLRQAPDELLALSNEICDIKIVFDAVGNALSTSVPLQENIKSVEPHLFLARIKLEEIDTVISRLGHLGSWNDAWHMGTWERISWRREKSKVVVLQAQLRDIRQNLSLALDAHTL